MTKQKREYPRKAWVLPPSFKPKEVTIVKCAYDHSSMFSGYDETDAGKSYHIDNLFNTKADAIAAGRVKVEEMQADIDKRQETANKRIAALDKAEGK